MSRIALSILREATAPDQPGCGLGLLISRALDRDDQKLLRLMTKRGGGAPTPDDQGIVRKLPEGSSNCGRCAVGCN